jgi:hypothetical protein
MLPHGLILLGTAFALSEGKINNREGLRCSKVSSVFGSNLVYVPSRGVDAIVMSSDVE